MFVSIAAGCAVESGIRTGDGTALSDGRLDGTLLGRFWDCFFSLGYTALNAMSLSLVGIGIGIIALEFMGDLDLHHSGMACCTDADNRTGRSERPDRRGWISGVFGMDDRHADWLSSGFVSAQCVAACVAQSEF